MHHGNCGLYNEIFSTDITNAENHKELAHIVIIQTTNMNRCVCAYKLVSQASRFYAPLHIKTAGSWFAYAWSHM